MKFKMLTANRLADGAVVYLGKEGSWIQDIQNASPFTASNTHNLIAEGDKSVNQQLIIGPYLIDVGVADDVITPVRFREKVRAGGPTSDLPKSHG